MKIQPKRSDLYFLKNENGFFKINISVKDKSLKIKINNFQSSYTYIELIDCDKRFRAFQSLQEIYSFISCLFKKKQIKINKDITLILKGFGKDIFIPLTAHHPLTSRISDLFLQSIQPIQQPTQILNTQNSPSEDQKPFPELQKTKKIKDGNEIFDMCFLKDRRLAVGTSNGITIYNKDTCQPEFSIQHFFIVYSVCLLRNGNLACCGYGLGIFEIKGKDYKLICKLKEHKGAMYKVIELKDGKLCSGSYDRTIKIWDNKNNYQCIQTLRGHNGNINSLIEVNEYIISASHCDCDNSVRIWNKSTYQCTKIAEGIYCIKSNGLSKLKENTLILGGENTIFTLDVKSFECQSFESEQLGEIQSICVLREFKVLLGNRKGDLICYNFSSDKIIFTEKVHNGYISSIIQSDNNQVFSSSRDQTINVYYLS